jgi:FAD/FMN-containing dehydrogenase
LLELADDFGYIVHNVPAAGFCPTSAQGVIEVLAWAAAKNMKVTVRGWRARLALFPCS